MPKGDGHGVVVLPGFLGDDGYNAPLRRYLGSLGYDAVGWAQGRNLGPRGDLLERALDYIREVAERTGGRVSLVGHSLGGIYARELAKEIPQQIRQVISLGSPFGEGRDTASYPGRLFYALNPREEVTLDQYVLTEPPPVPWSGFCLRSDSASPKANGGLSVPAPGDDCFIRESDSRHSFPGCASNPGRRSGRRFS